MKKIQHTAEIYISNEARIYVDITPDCAFELVLGKPPGMEIKEAEIDDAISLLIAGKELRDKMMAENAAHTQSGEGGK